MRNKSTRDLGKEMLNITKFVSVRLIHFLIVMLLLGCGRSETFITDTGSPVETVKVDRTESKQPQQKHKKPVLAKDSPELVSKINAVRQRIKFSETLLKEFPDLYQDLARFDASDKFDLLQKITAVDQKDMCTPTYKYKDKVTNTDIAGLVREILIEDDQELTSMQKRAIVDVIRGVAVKSSLSSELPPCGTGWYAPVPEVAPYVIGFLKDEDAEVRRDTLLVMSFKEAIPEVIRLLNDADFWVRKYAALVLVGLQNKEAIPEIMKLLKHQDGSTRRVAVDILAGLDAREATPELMKMINDRDWGVRIAVPEALVKFGVKEAIPEIIKLLKDRKENVRWFTAKLLGQSGVKEAIPELTECLKDKNVQVRFNSLEALYRLDAKGAILQIMKLLNTESGQTHRKVIEILSSWGVKEAIPELIQILKTNKDEYVQVTAAHALANLNAKNVIPELVSFLKDNPEGWVIDATSNTLLKLGGKDEAVILLNETSGRVRGLLAIALVEFGVKDKISPEAIEDIKPILKWREDYVKRARAALKELGISQNEIDNAQK